MSDEPKLLPQFVDDLGEVVDGEIVGEAREPTIGWVQWWDDARRRTYFKLYIDEAWYRSANRTDWDELNAYAEGMASIVRRTGGTVGTA